MPETRAQATVVITTRNRAADTCQAVASAFSQSVPVEVIVIDDASDDGTPDRVEQQFPDARVFRAEPRRGYIVNRNWAARLAQTNYIFSIDDDAIFTTPDVVAQTLALFDHPRIGAAAIPFCDIKISDTVRKQAPDADQCWITNEYIGTAHAVRRDLFLALGGYREHLVHQGEEGDYCLRMLDAGYVVRLGHGDRVHHFVSPKRSFGRMDFYGRRNGLLFAWHNAPLASLPILLAGTTVQGVRHAFRMRRFRCNLAGLACGFGSCLRHAVKRRPVAARSLRLFRKIRHAGAMPMSEVETLLGDAQEIDRVADGLPRR